MTESLRTFCCAAAAVLLCAWAAVGAEAQDFPPPAAPRQDTREQHGTGRPLEGAHLPLGVHWDEGMWLIRKPKRFTLRVNFRMDIDYVGIDDDRYVAEGGRTGDNRSGLVMRRARYTMRGDVGPHSYWKISIEATDRTAGLRDNFLDFRRFNETGVDALPNIKMGNFFEPYSLEQQTPSSRLTFMSRSAATLAMGLGRSFGIMAYDSFKQERFGYALGAFVSPLEKLGDFSDRVVDETVVRDGYGLTGRVWWMPGGSCRDPCRRLLLGASYSRRVNMSGVQFRARPETFKFDFVNDTDFSTDGSGVPLLEDASTANLGAVEAVWTRGPWSVQAEYYLTHVESRAGGDPFFHGGYALVSYWLTGECRPLVRGSVRQVRICNPRDPCKEDSGWGGVELAARFTTVDLNDGPVQGGSMRNVALGLNWHLAARRRLMFNLIRAQVDDGIADAPIWIFQTRLQLEF